MKTRTLIEEAIQANEELIAEIEERAKERSLGFLGVSEARMVISARHENRAFRAVLSSLRGNHKDLERYGDGK